MGLKRSGPPARRTPLARRGTDGPDGPSLRRGGRLAARSPRKADRYAAIAEACREAMERDRYRCRALDLIPGHRCAGPIDPQHVIPRSTRPDLAADPSNIVALCRLAHEWAGDHPNDARKLGLHGFSWDRPAP